MGSDLLGKFSGKKLPPVERTEEVELNLGLSLGGCFGGKPKEGGGLYRSSSTTLWRDGNGEGSDLSLMRTSSLPSGSLEETRKRKGLMDVIKMEVMKKELEERRKKFCGTAMGLKESSGSGGSGGSGSSGVTEVENQPAQVQVLTNPNVTGQKNHAESSSPTSVLSSPEQPNAYNVCPRPIKKVDIKTEPKTNIRKGKSKTSCTSGLNPNPNPSPTDEMPHVFTKGDGPNGKRVEGFLFKYKKGEEVRIVCVCHGSFLTPAEFVKHAGGNEVAHPLRRILVVPSPSFVL